MSVRSSNGRSTSAADLPRRTAADTLLLGRCTDDTFRRFRPGIAAPLRPLDAPRTWQGSANVLTRDATAG